MWRKLGLVYAPDGTRAWARHSVLTPTPWRLSDRVIRVYGGLRDDDGVSRIGFVDVDARDPTRVVGVCERPALDVGEPGMFDDNGIILGDLVADPAGGLRLYYVGFQLVGKVKFLAFSGLAVSTDGGTRFERLAPTPILDRSPERLFIGAIHTVLHENGVWRVWFSAGNGWETIGGVPYPRYDIWYTESPDGRSFPNPATRCLGTGPGEYRIGRPRVRRLSPGRLEMRFTYDTLDKRYRTGTALSADGVSWERDDALTGIAPSASGWDSEMLCYPAVIEVDGRHLMFYGGNGMGRTGFGVAEWTGAPWA